MERKHLNKASGLELFCRLDIGVLRAQDGELMYWVSEVDRTPNATLFACDALNWTESLALQFAETLPQYIGFV